MQILRFLIDGTQTAAPAETPTGLLKAAPEDNASFDAKVAPLIILETPLGRCYPEHVVPRAFWFNLEWTSDGGLPWRKNMQACSH